jgi:hypothetical protein
VQRAAPCSFPLVQYTQRTLPSLLHVLFSFLFIIQVFFCGGQSVQGAILVYSRGSCGSTTCYLFAHLLVCISQAGLEPASGCTGALLCSQYNVAWRSFVWARGSEYQNFASSWWFFSAKCCSSLSARFLTYRTHAACFLPLVAILDMCSIYFILITFGSPTCELCSMLVGSHCINFGG